MDVQNLTELVLQAQQGDTAALSTLIENSYRDIYYFALKTVKNEDIAADITQESCIEITKTLSNLREPTAFPVWIRRITYHQCTRYFKKTKDILPEENEEGESIFDSIPDDSEDSSPEKVYEDKEFKMTMKALIDSLPSEQCSALLLYYYEKMSVQQIAEIHGVPEGTIKSRLNYARKAFKKKVEEYEEKTGIKLHSLTPISILVSQLFKQTLAEMPPIHLSLPTASVTDGAGAAGGTGAIGVSGSTGAVLSAATNAIGAPATLGTAAVGAAADGKVPTKPKSKKTSEKAAASAATKVAVKKANKSSADNGNHANEKNNKFKTPILPIVCGLLITALLAAGAFVGIKHFTNRDKSSETLDGGDHEHYTTREWVYYDDIHCKLCDVCDSAMYKSEHQYGNWVSNDTSHYKICGVCNYTSHSVKHFARNWHVDNTGHFKVCETCNKTYASEKHTFDEWKYDETKHYHICDTCKQKFETAPHSFEWEYDKTTHYKACLCGKKIEEAPHNYVNDICVCGHTYLPFELKYQLNTDNQSYSVIGVSELNDTHIIIPKTFNNLPVTGIGDGAFANCTDLISIDLPHSLITMGEGVFRECTSLESIVLPEKLEYLPPYSFYGCAALTDVVFPRDTSVSPEYEDFWVGEYAFAECIRLENLDMEKNVSGFGAHAFENCISLKTFSIPTNYDNVGFIEVSPYTFAGCTALESIGQPYDFYIIREGAFSGCVNLKTIAIDGSYAEIYRNAFKDCHSLSIRFSGTSDTWHTVYKEEHWADPAMIVHCTDKSIDHLTHSYRLDMWSYNAEAHWKSCECGAAEEEWMAEPHNIVDRICTVCGMVLGSEGLEYELNAEENGYILVYLGDCTDTEIYIPSTYNSLPVVGIGYSAFEGCSHITNVRIPDSVRFIGGGAFLGTSITEIKIPEGVTVIEDNTFAMCQDLVSVSLPDSVTSIYMFAFSQCSSLQEIDLTHIRYIGSFAFQNCTSLTDIVLHDVLIEDSVFQGSGVVNVTLTGQTEIYAAAFANCTSLKTIRLPASITYIDILTFQNCTSLEHIYFDGTIEEWNSMDRMDYEEDMDEMEMELLWNHNTGNYTIHCSDGDLSK